MHPQPEHKCPMASTSIHWSHLVSTDFTIKYMIMNHDIVSSLIIIQLALHQNVSLNATNFNAQLNRLEPKSMIIRSITYTYYIYPCITWLQIHLTVSTSITISGVYQLNFYRTTEDSASACSIHKWPSTGPVVSILLCTKMCHLT